MIKKLKELKFPKFFQKLPVQIFLFLIWVAFFCVANQFVIGLPMSFLFKNLLSSTVYSFIYDLLLYALDIFCIIYLPWKLFKKLKPTRKNLGFTDLPTWTDIGLGIVGVIGTILISNLVSFIFEKFSWYDATETQDIGYNTFVSAPERVLIFLALVLIVPIAEELIFRGWLYGHLRRKIPKKYSVILSSVLVSLLFAVLHGQWNVGVTVFTMSIICCLFREVTGTIYAGIIVHILKNALAFFIIYVIGYS